MSAYTEIPKIKAETGELPPKVLNYLDERYAADDEPGGGLQPDQDATISGDWKFSRGITGEVNRSRLAVEREYSTANGDLFDSTARLEFSMRGQQATSQNPPGYSCASLSLFENGDNGAQYQGESARMLLISNRILFNRRLEVDMGGSGRANLRSGVEPGHQYAELGLHNASYPRWTIYGDQNESHSGNRKNVAVLDGARLEVRRSQPIAQSWIKTDNINADQRVNMELADTGHMELYAEYNGQRIGGVRFNADASTVELRATNGITLHDHTNALQDITFAANRGPVIQSPNGTRHRIVVNNDGTLTTEET